MKTKDSQTDSELIELNNQIDWCLEPINLDLDLDLGSLDCPTCNIALEQN